MEKAKVIGGQILIVVVGVLLGMKAYEYLNKPRVVPPATKAA